MSPRWRAALAISPEAFDAQIGHLVAQRWQPTTFTDAVTGSSSGRFLAVTFDDGFASVLRYAAPILARHGAPGTLFAPTSFMEDHAQLSWPGVEHWRLTEDATELQAMNWDDLRSLADAGWEIGSHTCTHPHLTTLDDDALARELCESRAICSEQMGRACRSIAYPYGDADKRVIAATAAAGYETGARLSASLKADGPLEFPRVGIYNANSWFMFKLKVAKPTRLVRATR